MGSWVKRNAKLVRIKLGLKDDLVIWGRSKADICVTWNSMGYASGYDFNLKSCIIGNDKIKSALTAQKNKCPKENDD